MSSRRDDGLSIAVWENSPWRAFFRYRDAADADGQAESAQQPFRLGQDTSQVHHQDNTDDIREIFGRAMDATRSKKAFASAAQIRKDVMRSEARLMAEDNRSWGSGRYQWNQGAESNFCDLDDEGEDDGEEERAAELEPVKSQQYPNENLSGPRTAARNNSVRVSVSTSVRRRTGTASGAVEEVEGHGGAEWSASEARTSTRLQVATPGAGESHPQLSPMNRSPQAPTRGPASPLGDSAARGRMSRPAMSNGVANGAASAKLLHVQAANMPARHSFELHGSRKLLSPTGLALSRRSNSFDGSRQDGVIEATVGSRSGSGAGGGAGIAASLVHDRALGNMIRERRSATTTGIGALGVAAHGLRVSGSGSCVELPATLQRDGAVLRNWSRRTALLGGGERRASGPDGGSLTSGSHKNPMLMSPMSGRVPEPHAARRHALPKPSKAASLVSAGVAAGLVTPRGAGSYSQLMQLHATEVKKLTISSVPAVDPSRLQNGVSSPGSPGLLPDGRTIMGRLRGLFAAQ